MFMQLAPGAAFSPTSLCYKLFFLHLYYKVNRILHKNVFVKDELNASEYTTTAFTLF